MRLLKPSTPKYEDIGRNQVYLKEEEEVELVRRYRDERRKLREYILARKLCVQHFLKRYKETKAAGRSVAKLSADYNPRKAGLNQRIETKFDRSLSGHALRAYTSGIGMVLHNLNLSDEMFEEMAQHLKPSAKYNAIRERISEIENTLFCSVLMATQELAKRYASNLLGIDEADAGQQAGMYMLESIRKYDPEYRTPDGWRIKLVTYCYSRAKNLLKEWILTNSRLVRVPRSKMERILVIVEAYEGLPPNNNILALTRESNKLLKERKLEAGKKVQDKDEFTVDEVDGLIKILMSSYVHLDQPYRKGMSNNGFTVGDMLSDGWPSVVEDIEAQDERELLIELLQDNLEDIEFQVIMLRWLHDPTDKVPKALTDVGKLLASEYGGTEYSRESIRLIEKAAIAKLRDVEEVQELWSQ